jgi:hypothetical protein
VTLRPALAAALALCSPAALGAQWGGYLALGARAGTPLVRDAIVNPIDVRQDIGGVVGAGVTTPADGPWSGEAALDVTFTGLQRDERGESLDLGALTTWSFSVAVRRTVARHLTARAGAGALFYRPQAESGIFGAGTGGAAPLVLLGATYAPPAGRRFRLALDLRYDAHRFITPALRSVGFEESRVVHRVALVARVGLGGPR